MADPRTARAETRNVAILAHVDAGKTTTTEQLLYVCGRRAAPGSVDRGTAATDALPQERARGITIASSVVVLPWRGCRVHLVDTPGHSDVASTVERVLSAVDAAVLVVAAPDGVQPHTERFVGGADAPAYAHHPLPQQVRPGGHGPREPCAGGARRALRGRGRGAGAGRRGGLWARLSGRVPAAAAGDYPVRFAARTRGKGGWEPHVDGYREKEGAV